MKIIHATSAHNPYDPRILWKQCASLAARGFDVTLLAPFDQPLPDEAGVKFQIMPMPKGRFMRFVKMPWHIFKVLWRNKDGLSHVHDPDLLPVVLLLRLFGRRVVFDMHENVPKQILQKVWIPIPVRKTVSWLWRGFERVAFRFVPVVLAAKSCSDDYQWVRTDRKADVYNYPMAQAVLAIERKLKDRPTVTYVGGIMEERASDVLMDAIDILHARGQCPYFDMIGPTTPPNLIDIYRERINKAGLDDRVRFYGYVRNDEALKIVQGAHIGLSFLRAKPNYINTFATKMLEYMALSMPIITSNFPLYSTITQEHDCGLIVDPEKAEELADAIVYLLDNRDEAERMGANGRKAVAEHYEWESQFANLLELYARLGVTPLR